MSAATSIDARMFQRCALQRYEDAQALLRTDHTTGAVYMAGYAIECILKALILVTSPRSDRPAILAGFRGVRAHDYRWLLNQYRERGGPGAPRVIGLAFTVVDYWSTDLRYVPRTIERSEADEFLDATGRILGWAEGRI